MTSHRVPMRPGSSGLATAYSAWLCDVWGVLHNGVAAFPAATDALCRYRQAGGHVVLLTNAPRPAPSIISQLETLGVPAEAYDSVVTSGDVTRDMLSRVENTPVFHIGPDRDLPLFEGMPINFTGADQADILLCTGLFDDTTELPEDYAKTLSHSISRGAKMYCANPDIVVHRGDALVYCAGALAAEYLKLGGEVVYSGKPHGAIYDLCFHRLSTIAGREISRPEVLAIGDGMNTDILGARQAGVDSLYVADGIHRDDIIGTDGLPDADRLDALFENQKQPPVAAVFGLSW